MAAPLIHLGKLYGVINLESKTKAFFTRERQVQVETIAGVAASYLAYQQLFAEKQILAQYFGPYAEQVNNPQFFAPRKVDWRVPILFADIRNSTVAMEALTAEQAQQMLQDYMAEMARIVRKNGGMIGNEMGDGIIALFNMDPKPEQAQQVCAACHSALSTAIEMRESFGRLRQAWYRDWASTRCVYPKVGIGIGIHFGDLVFFGRFGVTDHWQLTGAGPDVHLAAKLGDEAKDSEILVSSRFRDCFPPLPGGGTSSSDAPGSKPSCQACCEQFLFSRQLEIGKDKVINAYVFESAIGWGL